MATGLHRPVASILVIGAGVLAGFQLGRQDRPMAALLITTTVALVAGLAVSLLTQRMRVAETAALRDTLTGLPNKKLLDDRIQQALARSRRTGDPFALLVIDLDGFKVVNDTRGHEAGNTVLRSVARRLDAAVRETDTVARVGGDEFVILSPGTQEDSEAAALVGRLRQTLRRPHRVEGSFVELDSSIGWAIYPQDGASPDDLLSLADGKMYATKRDTSEESVFDRAPLDAGVVRDVELALEHREIVVHYQPIVDLRSGEVTAAEALVRRAQPTGLLGPAAFMSHVERTPVIRALTLAVASDALARLEEWDAIGHSMDAAVNVPYRLLDDAELITGIAALLRRSPIDPARLTLEVVPSGPGAGAELDSIETDRLRRLGVKLSLDDLGRASSIAAIRCLPLDQAKIDAMFLHGVARDDRSRAIVRSLVELAHELGLEVVAEGVETRVAWEMAARLGCDRAQGFYLGHPQPAAELTTWLQRDWPVVTV